MAQYLPPDHWSRSMHEFELLTNIATAAMKVCEFDWSDNDSDAAQTIFELRQAVHDWLSQ